MSLYDLAQNIKAALDAAEEEHPGSASLPVLHSALGQGLAAATSNLGFSPSEVSNLGGGTPKDGAIPEGGPAPGG